MGNRLAERTGDLAAMPLEESFKMPLKVADRHTLDRCVRHRKDGVKRLREDYQRMSRAVQRKAIMPLAVKNIFSQCGGLSASLAKTYSIMNRTGAGRFRLILVGLGLLQLHKDAIANSQARGYV